MIKPRATVDVNVFVSGMITKRGYPFELIEALKNDLFTLVNSSQIISELTQVLRRDEFERFYGVSEKEASNLIQFIRQNSEMNIPGKTLDIKVRDPKDEIILFTALTGEADYLVTGDKDLLVLKHHKTIGKLKIVTPSEFLAVLE